VKQSRVKAVLKEGVGALIYEIFLGQINREGLEHLWQFDFQVLKGLSLVFHQTFLLFLQRLLHLLHPFDFLLVLFVLLG
jgi:hypothetical protein